MAVHQIDRVADFFANSIFYEPAKAVATAVSTAALASFKALKTNGGHILDLLGRIQWPVVWNCHHWCYLSCSCIFPFLQILSLC